MYISQFHTGTLYVSSEKKNPQAQNLKLEFNDNFKINNSSSQEANDLLPLLEQTVDLHSVQLYTKFRDASDHIAGYVAFKACQILQTAAPWSYASAHTHGDSYVNLLSRDGLKHPSKQLSDCVARIFTILEASSAAILKSTLPSKKPVKLL